MPRPKLDYFNGRPFAELVQGNESWDWALKFTDGSLIRNTDKRRTAAPVESALVGTSLGSVQEDSNVVWTLNFIQSAVDGIASSAEVQVTPSQTVIADPVYSSDEEVYAVPEPVEDTLPPDPSPDRVASGPVTPLEAAGGDE